MAKSKESKNALPQLGGESFWWRVLWAIALLGIFLAARTVLSTCASKWLPILQEASKTGWIDDVSGRIPVRISYTGFKGFDTFVSGFVAFFTPALAGLDHETVPSTPILGRYGSLYAPQRLQSLTFLVDVTSLNAILALESCRRGNSWTVASIPVIFLLGAQLLGAGQVVPLYLFLQYIFLPPTKYVLRANHQVPTRYAKTLLPAVLSGYVLPTLGCYWPTSSLETLQIWNFIWQFFPIWILLFHEIFARLVSDDPANEKKGQDVAADLVWLRLTYEFLFLLSAGTYLYVFSVSPIPFTQLFIRGIWDYNKEVGTIAEGAGIFLKWDEIFLMLGVAVWILLCFRDLKREKNADVGWAKVVVIMLSTGLVFGPGASMAVMWAWREEILVGKEGRLA